VHALSNRRAHLVCALTLFAVASARLVAEMCGVGTLSPTAIRACTVAVLVLAALIVGRTSRMQHGFAPMVAVLCSVAGGCVGLVTEQSIYADRPTAALSFVGIDLGGAGGVVLGAIVGLVVGAVFAAFGVAARALHRRSPELACVAGWALAASASLAARTFVLIVPCAIGAAIQIGQMRRTRTQSIVVGPYR
jgi:hypothetical protein